MIAHLLGKVAGKEAGAVVIDVGGVGYGVLVTLRDFERAVLHSQQKFYTYHHIREQSQELYGFSETTSKKLFEQLLNVKNVGPKVALAVLDIGPAEAVRTAIASGDVKFLQAAKGVGKRAAEQMVVELRDKVGLLVSDQAEDVVRRSAVDQKDEALQALVALGYLEIDAQLALQRVSKDQSTEDRVKQALKNNG